MVNNLGTQDVRLRRGVFPETMRQEANPVWFYEYRNAKDSAWNVYYAFGEWEASLWDLECANFWVAHHPDSFQRKQILAVKFIRSSVQKIAANKGTNENGESQSEINILGKIMLADDVVKVNMGGKTKILKQCKTEMERLEALKEHFGIYLTNEEQHGIKGFETEIKE